MKKILLPLAILGFITPHGVWAAVTISEVAWMGGVSSANHEWIELHNDSDSVDVAGWTLTDGMNLNIALTGTVGAGEYVVLERTSDESAPSNAFLIYTGALVNGGATLVLRRSDNSIEDQAAGGENWENIGGDNVTKETAQYSTGGWITALATPGSANRLVTAEPEQSPTSTAASTSGGSSKLMKPSPKEAVKKLIQNDSEIKLKITAPTVGYVNQSVEFEIEASGLGKTITNSLSYVWNFGDLSTSSRKSTTHTFLYPGTYMVMSEAKFGKYDAITSHEITILPVAISMTRNAYGDIQINNDAKYDVDLSSYLLQGKSKVMFPSNTILLSGQTITIPYIKTGGINLPVSLFDAKGVNIVKNSLAFSAENFIEESQSKDTKDIPIAPIVSLSEPVPNFGFATTGTLVKEEEIELDNITATTSIIGRKAESEPLLWPYMALVGLIIVGIGSIILQPKAGKNS